MEASDPRRRGDRLTTGAERCRVWCAATFPGIELMDVTSSDRCWRVVHDRFCVSLCRGGATDYRYRGRTHLKSAGAVTVHEPGEAYVAHRQYGLGAATVFSIAPALIDGWAEGELVGSKHFVPEPAAESQLSRRLLRLARAIRAGLPLAEIEERAGEALAEMFARRTEGGRRPPPRRQHRVVARVKARLQDSVHEKVSLAELAEEVGLHKLYLLSVFREEVGLPPHAYQLQLRVSKARTMLAAGAPIADVATRLGFSDQSHLSRHFRRAFGVTPGAYARLLAPAAPKTGPRGAGAPSGVAFRDRLQGSS